MVQDLYLSMQQNIANYNINKYPDKFLEICFRRWDVCYEESPYSK